MAEMNPEKIPAVEVPETGEPVAVHEPTYVSIPPNRPRKVYGGMWGSMEIAAVSAGALVLLTVAMVYFFWIIPSNRELAKNISEADRLEAELMSAKSKYGEITDTKTQVAKLVTSVDDFETRFLPLPVNGQTALYQKINGLILAFGLVNTTGPDYAPLETVDQNQGEQTDEEKGRAKYRSLYPGVYVSTTLEGSYQNLRRFIREVETGNEFVVISAVELAPSDTEQQKENPAQNAGPTNPAGVNPTLGVPTGSVGQPPTSQPSKAKGKTHGETVSLHIEMAAYFRRPNFVPRLVEAPSTK